MKLSLGHVGKPGKARNRLRLGSVNNASTTSNSVSSNQFIVQQGRNGRPTVAEPGQGGWPSSGPVVGRRQVQPLPEDPNDWISYDVMDGVRVQARRGTEVAVQQVGTDDVPVALITPGRIIGQRQQASGMTTEYSKDSLGFIFMLAPGVINAVKKAVARGKAARGGHGGRDHEAAGITQLGVGEMVDINGIECTIEGFDSSGAILIDSDGKRVHV